MWSKPSFLSIHKMRKKLQLLTFNYTARNVLDCAPILCDPKSGVAIVSQVCHDDLFMYLMALKSFVRYITPAKVYVVDDTSLSANDKQWLRKMIDNVEIIPTTAVKNEQCPSGGCWERLLCISDVVANHYVIQLDGDTLTLRR